MSKDKFNDDLYMQPYCDWDEVKHHHDNHHHHHHHEEKPKLLPVYNVDVYFDKVPLVTKLDQMKRYLDKKLEGGVKVEHMIDKHVVKEIAKKIEKSTESVHEHLHHVEHHVCDDIQHAKHDILRHEDLILKEMGYGFCDLNEAIKKYMENN